MAVEKYAFVITHSVPSDDVLNSVDDVFVLSLTEDQKNALVAEIEDMFMRDGDGNDSWLGLEVTMLGAEVTADQLLQHCRHSLLNTSDEDEEEDEEDEDVIGDV